jgi:small subunit ribosomal protein S21
MKALKIRLAKDGMFRELKRRRFYEKPSVKKKRKQQEARRRWRKGRFTHA